MDEQFIMENGMRITAADKSFDFRIVYMAGEDCFVCNLLTTKLDIRLLPSVRLFNFVEEGTASAAKADAVIIDRNALSESARKTFERNLDIADRITKAYGPDFTRLCGKSPKPVIEEIIEEYGLSRTAVWNIIKRYIREGRTESSLLDRTVAAGLSGGGKRRKYNYTKKTGRPKEYEGAPGKMLTPTDFANFDRGIDLYLKSQVKTFKKAYETMRRLYYTKKIRLSNGSFTQESFPPDQCPSYKQFYQYAVNHITAEDRKKAKLGERKFHNDERLAISSSMEGVLGPGDLVEIDANEMDVSVVSRLSPDEAIGRTIIYLAIDVYTRMILGMAISLDNNSIIALTNLFFNFREDKKKLLARYNISYDGLPGYGLDRIWPTGVKPSRIQTDHGPDFESNEFARILNELNITQKTVQVATGSYKAIVERMNETINKAIAPHVEGAGYIDPEHETDHHKNAVLNIDELTEIVLRFIIEHNSTALENYDRTKDMIKKRVKPAPYLLWEYGLETQTNPAELPQMEEYRWKLMIPGKARYSRFGIFFEGLSYFNRNDDELIDEMIRAQNKSVKMDIRYDPRSVGHIYYLKNGRMETADLITSIPWQESHSGDTWFEYRKDQKQDKADRAAAAEERTKSIMQFDGEVEKIVKNAKKRRKSEDLPRKNNTKDMRKNRAAEKQDVAAEHAYSVLAGEEQEDLNASRLESADDVSAAEEEIRRSENILSREEFEQIDPAGMSPEEMRQLLMKMSEGLLD